MSPVPVNPAPTVDLSTCDREPIHIPGSIQPHGLLLVLSATDLGVVAASANAIPILAPSLADLLGRPLDSVFDEPSCAAIRQATAGGEAARPGGIAIQARPRRPWLGRR